MSKLCQQPIIVYIPEHEVSFWLVKVIGSRTTVNSEIVDVLLMLVMQNFWTVELFQGDVIRWFISYCIFFLDHILWFLPFCFSVSMSTDDLTVVLYIDVVLLELYTTESLTLNAIGKTCLWASFSQEFVLCLVVLCYMRYTCWLKKSL